MAKTSSSQASGALRVCHVVGSTAGARWVAEQLRGLRDRHDMDVTAIVSGTQGPLVDLLRSSGIRSLACDFVVGQHYLQTLQSVVGLARVLRRERFDVVQTHVFHTMLVGRLAGWLADVPLRVSMVAGPYHLQAESSRAFDADTCFMEHLLVASCELTRQLYRDLGVPEERLALVYYGADESRFVPAAVTPAGVRAEHGWPADTPVVGCVAYFYGPEPRGPWSPPEVWNRGLKGHEDIVRAARLVLAERPDAKFLLVGDGWQENGEAHRRAMIQLAADLGIAGGVVFTGYRDDVPAILADLDVSVQASLNDNLGGTIESLLMARPLVATRVGGLVDTVRDGETGVLVAPGNPADLARGILALLRDPARARALGQAGRDLMLARFTLDRTVDDLAALYRARVAGGAPGYRPAVSAARALEFGPRSLALAAHLRLIDNPVRKARDGRGRFGGRASRPDV